MDPKRNLSSEHHHDPLTDCLTAGVEEDRPDHHQGCPQRGGAGEGGGAGGFSEDDSLRPVLECPLQV